MRLTQSTFGKLARRAQGRQARCSSVSKQVVLLHVGRMYRALRAFGQSLK